MHAPWLIRPRPKRPASKAKQTAGLCSPPGQQPGAITCHVQMIVNQNRKQSSQHQPIGPRGRPALALALALRAIFRPALLPPFNTQAVERPAHNVVTHTGKVSHTPATNEHDRVLLQVVTLAADVRRHFLAVAQTNTRDLPQRGVRLLGRRGPDLNAHTTLLRARLKVTDLRLGLRRNTGLADELVDGRHGEARSLKSTRLRRAWDIGTTNTTQTAKNDAQRAAKAGGDDSPTHPPDKQQPTKTTELVRILAGDKEGMRWREANGGTGTGEKSKRSKEEKWSGRQEGRRGGGGGGGEGGEGGLADGCELLDLVVTDPDLLVGFQVNQVQVHLIEAGDPRAG